MTTARTGRPWRQTTRAVAPPAQHDELNCTIILRIRSGTFATVTEEHAAADLGSSVWDLYQRYLVPAIFAPWAEEILKLAKLGSGERVLDVACGTGVVARGAREALGSGADVVGCDINPDTLKVARSASAGLAIEWRQSDACSLPFPDSDFDVVVCQQGLQFFPDRAAALGEMRRVLRDGGRVVLAVWSSIERSPGFRALADAIERHMSVEAANRYRHGPFGYGPMANLQRELAAVGFVGVSVEERNKAVRFPSAEEFVRRYVGSPLPSASSGPEEEARTQVISDVAAALHVSPSDAVQFPIASYLAVGRR